MPAPTKLINDIFKSKSSSQLSIVFSSVTITSSGQAVSKQDAQAPPTIFLKQPSLPTSPKSYLCISIDPDAPFPSYPFLGPILHGVQTSLVAQQQENEGGSFMLTSDGRSPLVPWIPPNPPGISAPHRYMFVVWEQPDDLTETSIREKLGWNEGVGRMARMRWDLEAFKTRLGLERCIGGSWFVCKASADAVKKE